jgi:hypothetical protein
MVVCSTVIIQYRAPSHLISLTVVLRVNIARKVKAYLLDNPPQTGIGK